MLSWYDHKIPRSNKDAWCENDIRKRKRRKIAMATRVFREKHTLQTTKNIKLDLTGKGVTSQIRVLRQNII